jgi:hypothetical protein
MFSEPDQHFPQDVCDALREQGLQVDARTHIVVGQRDARLCVGVPSAPSGVELLGPFGDLPMSSHWHAVRVDGERRSVWEGPSRQSPRSELQAFLWELACLDQQRLSSRWRPLERSTGQG